jgi:two-component system, cell cycle sensor histidine kinase and response regulator CckA
MAKGAALGGSGGRSRGVAWLRQGDRRYRTLIENLSDVITVLDAEGTFLYVSPSVRRLLGHQPHDLEGRSAYAFIPPDEVEGLRARFAEALVGGPGDDGRRVEFRFRHGEGAWRQLEGVGRRLPGSPPQLLVNVRDITDYRRAESAQMETEERYHTLFDRNPFPMWAYDLKTLRFLAVNDAAVEHYGYSREEFLDMTIRDIRPPQELGRLEQDVALVRSQSIDPQSWNSALWRHRKKDGTVFEVEVRSSTLSFGGWEARLVLAKDVSAERRLEEQLRQAQRMEAVGRLSAGVAHDFNNLLGVILGYGGILRSRIKDEALRSKLEEIIKAGEKAAGLTRQLLTFSRKQVLQPVVLDLNAVVADMNRMLQRVLGEDIDLMTRPAPELGGVRADPGQVEQVLMNLVANARDAMPRGGHLTIETGNVVLDEGYAAQHGTVRPGPYVMLAVSDTGSGMDAETQRHIFEPFFTTKEAGRGTGLGLATVYGIVTQSEGHIWVYSEPGRGTTFKVYLPRVDAAAPALATTRAEARAPKGTETILLVEDDEQLRELAREVLSDHGYTVLCASSGPAALAAAEAYAGEIHLLLTDVVMMGMSGRELSEALFPSRRDTRVLFTSGYTDDAIVHHGVLEQEMAFLQKPFPPAALLSKVRQALDTPPSPARR